MATKKLTNEMLKRLIAEEKAKMGAPVPTEKRAKDTEEVDADEYGTAKSLEKDIDHMKALKIQEAAYRKALRKLIAAKKKIRESQKPREVTLTESELREALKKVRARRKKLRDRINSNL